MRCPACESTDLRWAAEWSAGTMAAQCRACGAVYTAKHYGGLDYDYEQEDNDAARDS